MKPPPFLYRRPRSLEEALALLAEHGDDAAVLAGGQSLLIELRQRSVRPRVVVDIDRVEDPGLRRVDGGRIGALVRHRDLEHRDLEPRDLERPGPGPLGRLLATVAPWVAHPPIRVRGTFGGSVAWAHPCAEWNAVVAALGGTVTLDRAGGKRTVTAADWYVAPHRTARRPDELVTSVSLPELAVGTQVGFAEHRRTSASFALVAAVAAIGRGGDGAVTEAHIGLAGAGPVPLRAVDAERLLVGAHPTSEAIDAAGRAAGEACDPVAEAHASAEYRRHVAAELVRRVLTGAVAA